MARQVHQRLFRADLDPGSPRHLPYPFLLRREAGGIGEDHPPRHRGHAAEQLAVDEVPDPAERIAQRRAGRDHVHPLRDRQALGPAVEGDRDDPPEQAAVVRHPLQPHEAQLAPLAGERNDDLKRIAQVVAARVVDDDGDQAPSDEHADDPPEEQVEHRLVVDGQVALGDSHAQQPIGKVERHQVHQAVPAQRQSGYDLRIQPSGKRDVASVHQAVMIDRIP